MTEALDIAFAEAKTLPTAKQEALGQWMRDYIEQERSGLTLTAQQQAEVTRRLNEPNPVFATDEQVAALYAKFTA